MSAIISTCLEINYDCVPDFTQIDDPDLHTPTLDDSIEYHVQWLGKHHFCLPTRKHIKNHGLLHSARVACFIPMLDRLWRQLDPSTPALSERKMLLLQLAGAFHDIARQADGEDLWDNESATALLHYLHEVLGVELAEAIEIAEVVANKDPHSDGYYKFEIPTDDTGAWVKDVDGQCAPVKLTTHHESERGYLHQLLQTVDSLEIHRCSKTFDMRYTDLFNQFSHLPIEYFAEIRTQYAAWLSQHGDLSPMKSQDQRARFSAPDTCMTKLVEGTQLDELPLIKALHTGTGIITALVRELSEDKWQQRLNKGTLSVRGLPVPKNRSAAEVIASELATSTETPNKYRSTSDISLDRGVYCSAGVVISEPTATEIIASSGQNLASGNGDKTAYLFRLLANPAGSTLEDRERSQAHQAVEAALKSPLYYISRENPAWHSETLRHLQVESHFEAVYFTLWPTRYTTSITHASCFHALSQALIYQTALSKAKGTPVPMVELHRLSKSAREVVIETELLIQHIREEAQVYLLQKDQLATLDQWLKHMRLDPSNIVGLPNSETLVAEAKKAYVEQMEILHPSVVAVLEALATSGRPLIDSLKACPSLAKHLLKHLPLLDLAQCRMVADALCLPFLELVEDPTTIATQIDSPITRLTPGTPEFEAYRNHPLSLAPVDDSSIIRSLMADVLILACNCYEAVRRTEFIKSKFSDPGMTQWQRHIPTLSLDGESAEDFSLAMEQAYRLAYLPEFLTATFNPTHPNIDDIYSLCFHPNILQTLNQIMSNEGLEALAGFDLAHFQATPTERIGVLDKNSACLVSAPEQITRLKQLTTLGVSVDLCRRIYQERIIKQLPTLSWPTGPGDSIVCLRACHTAEELSSLLNIPGTTPQKHLAHFLNTARTELEHAMLTRQMEIDLFKNFVQLLFEEYQLTPVIKADKVPLLAAGFKRLFNFVGATTCDSVTHLIKHGELIHQMLILSRPEDIVHKSILDCYAKIAADLVREAELSFRDDALEIVTHIHQSTLKAAHFPPESPLYRMEETAKAYLVKQRLEQARTQVRSTDDAYVGTEALMAFSAGLGPPLPTYPRPSSLPYFGAAAGGGGADLSDGPPARTPPY